jgi:hypothetical protein
MARYISHIQNLVRGTEACVVPMNVESDTQNFVRGAEKIEYPPLHCTSTREFKKKSVDHELPYVLGSHASRYLVHHQYYQFNYELTNLSSRKENDTSVISHKENSYYLSSLIWNFSQWNKPCGPVVIHNIPLHSSTQNNSITSVLS